MPRTSSKRKSRSPCRHGRKKSLRRGCKAKPGPKRSRRSSRRSRRSRRKCSRGMRKGSRVCKRKSGPKRSRRSRKSRKSSPRKNYQCKYGRNAKGFCVPRDVCKSARLKNKRCVSKGGLGADQWNVPPLYGCKYGRSGDMNNSLNQPVGKCQKPGVFEKLRKKLFGDDAQQSPAEVMQRHYAGNDQENQARQIAAQMGRDFRPAMPARMPQDPFKGFKLIINN